EKKLITANFSPQAESSYSGKFEIASNGGNISFYLYGTGIILEQSEDSIAFGHWYEMPEEVANRLQEIVSLDESHALLLYSSNDYTNIYARIATISGTNHVSYGKRFLVTDKAESGRQRRLMPLDSDTVLFGYIYFNSEYNSYHVKVIDNINPENDTLTIGNEILINGEQDDSTFRIYTPDIVPLTKSKAVIVYPINYTETVSVGIGEAFIVEINNAIITKGPEFVFDNYTILGAGDGDISVLSAKKINEDDFFVFYQTWDRNDSMVIVGKVDGFNIDFGSKIVLAPCSNYRCISAIGMSDPVYYSQKVHSDKFLLVNDYRDCGSVSCDITYQLWNVGFSGFNIIKTQITSDYNIGNGWPAKDIDNNHILFSYSVSSYPLFVSPIHRIIRIDQDNSMNYGKTFESSGVKIDPAYFSHSKLDESRILLGGINRTYDEFYGIRVLSLETFDYPTVTNDGGATNVTHNSAILRGEMTDLGGADYATVKLYWGESDGGTSPAAWDHVIDVGTSSLAIFSSDALGLDHNTTYYYRAYADIGSGLEDWADTTETFTTVLIDSNVYGWAFSDNVGWISFNCNNDYNGNSTMGPEHMDELESRCTYPYSTKIDLETGEISGYAWSDNVGWITFNQGELTGCPSGACEALMNTTTGNLSGWAKAINSTTEDYGWISLRELGAVVLSIQITDSYNNADLISATTSVIVDTTLGQVRLEMASTDPPVLLWAKNIDNYEIMGAEVDDTGVYVTGSRELPYPAAGKVPFIGRYATSSGNNLWHKAGMTSPRGMIFDIALDDDYIYAVGFFELGGGGVEGHYIEKRNKLTGELEWAHEQEGPIYGSHSYNTVAVDSNYIYTGLGSDNGKYKSVQRMNKSDGSIATWPGFSYTTTFRDNDMFIDEDAGIIHVAGGAKYSLADGSLVHEGYGVSTSVGLAIGEEGVFVSNTSAQVRKEDLDNFPIDWQIQFLDSGAILGLDVDRSGLYAGTSRTTTEFPSLAKINHFNGNTIWRHVLDESGVYRRGPIREVVLDDDHNIYVAAYNSNSEWDSYDQKGVIAKYRNSVYASSGNLTSANLLSGESGISSISTFGYNVSSLPQNTSLTIQFSQNETDWYDSQGTSGGTDTLFQGNYTIDLTPLNWSESNFYYRLLFTSDGLGTPIVDEITIHFDSDSSSYGVSITGTTGEFHGHAYGGGPTEEAVIGWISFNCEEGSSTKTDICSTKKYLTWIDSNVFNSAPFIEDLSVTEPTEAIFCNNAASYFLNWRFKDNDMGDYENTFELKLVNTTTNASTTHTPGMLNPGEYVDGDIQTLAIPVRTSEDFTGVLPQITYGETYSWEVRVQDGSGLWSHDATPWEAGTTFTVPEDYPNPSFTMNPEKPKISEEVNFTNTSTQGFYPISSLLWDLGDGTSTTTPNPINIYSEVSPITVELTVTDDGGRSCSANQIFNVRPGKPEYIEVIPRSGSLLDGIRGFWGRIWNR
ncbi:MAG: PKD domain-containing protein, partial [Candidatus Heimdallarchaeaceae archaeon]